MCVNNLPKVVIGERNGRELNSRPLESQANALTITLPGHNNGYGILQIFENRQICGFNAAWVIQYTDSGQIRQKDCTIGSLCHAKFPSFLISDSRSASYKLQIRFKSVLYVGTPIKAEFVREQHAV